jgi:hypothetical protein
MAKRSKAESEETKEAFLTLAQEEICRIGYEKLSLLELGKKPA